MDSMKWGTFLLWGVFDVIIAIVAFFFLKETQGLSLEAIAQTEYRKGKQGSATHKVDDEENS